MYCPKCGAEAIEEQRFCKACGTNLQLINNALKSGGKGLGPWNLDPEELKRNVTDFVDSWKKGWKDHAHEPHKWKAGWDQFQQGRPYREDARALRRRAKEELRRRNLPQPHQWMKYSRQHSFKEGLVSLFGGAGMAYAVFKIGQEVLNSGIIHEIPNIKDPQVHGLEVLARTFWLFMLIPMLKGLGQVIYATFFSESMKTLSERFTIPADELESGARATAPKVERNTAPQAPANAETRDFEQLNEPPPSVTEGTTQFFEEARTQRRRESQ